MNMPLARDVLAEPVKTDADVLARVAAIISEDARALRTLWLFFLDSRGTQSNVVVPIDDLPGLPDEEFAGGICQIVSQVVAESVPGGTAVVTLSRPGPPVPGEGDLRWAAALRRGAARHETPVRMVCLATPGGVRELGSVAAEC